ncbi:hypothetical protein C3E98_012240 [Pseudomonas sp. MWU13-2625]|nr:hypothetical protein C3E97_003415 [Pseudomonas sp. MWU12-2115]RBL71448.1 hypothetical protein C3E98_012240 [Pseudomonas sp. MWU13-2625]
MAVGAPSRASPLPHWNALLCGSGLAREGHTLVPDQSGQLGSTRLPIASMKNPSPSVNND